MLEGLEISEIQYSYVRKNGEVFRFDSNYFLKKFIDDESLIRTRKYSTIKEIGAELKSFGAYSLNNDVHYLESGIPFIRGVNMKKGRISFNDMIFIDKTANSLLWKSEVKSEMVLLSMSGTIGDVAIASKKWKYPINSNQDIAKIETLGKINPYFLYAFLASKFGQNYLIREARGSVQQHVFLSQMERFEIPLLNEKFVQSIQTTIEKSDEILYLSDDLFNNAEALLLETLDLKDFEPSTEGINVKSYKESFLVTGRLDAEYYQPKYEEIIQAIKTNKTGYCKLESCIKNYSTGFPYKSESYIEDGIPLIRINNIQRGELDLSNAARVPFDDISLSLKDVANENDILISMSGTIGNSCKIPKGIKALVNQRIMRITPINFNVDVLPLVINSIIGKYQLERIGTGGVQTNISSTDIKEILIPIIENTQQEKIAVLVEESFRLKKQSEQLLETAKRAVEIAIEQDEDAAMRYIEQAQRASI